MTFLRPTIAALLVSFLFTACLNGGGGGSDAIIPPPPLPADLQTTVPEPASTDLKVLNTLRGQLGLGLLIEDSRLVTVSNKHAIYENAGLLSTQIHTENGTQFWSTEENSGDPRFSGTTANDRCLAAGYPGICNDVATVEGGGYDASKLPGMWWVGNLDVLLARPYGGIMMFMQSPRDAGVFRVGGQGFLGSPYSISWHFGIPASGQRQGGGFVLTYPLPDSTVLPMSLPLMSFGHAINLHINAGETLTVDSFTLLDRNGNIVAATLLTQATDPEKFVPGHVAVLVPNAPLVRGMNYTVNFWGKRNGTGFSRTWNFSVS